MYAKIFASLFDGSMRGHSDLILVFVNLLCHADRDGIVDRHWQTIVDETGLSPERVMTALKELEGPDEQSRSRNDDGRRIRLLDSHRNWGWEIINFRKYDSIRSAADRREYMKTYMSKKRKNIKKNKNVNSVLTSVSKLAPQTQTQTQTQTQHSQIAGKDRPSRPTSPIKLCDEKWIESLRPDCEIQGIDLDDQIIRAKRWLLAKPGRKFTRKFFVNWLNRCDRVVLPDRGLGKKQASISMTISDEWETARTNVLHALQECAAGGGDISRCLSSCRDKYRDLPARNGEDAVNEGYEIFKNQQKMAKSGSRHVGTSTDISSAPQHATSQK